MAKDLLIAPFVSIIVLGIWYFKLEPTVKKALKKYLEKKSEKETCTFIDPR